MVNSFEGEKFIKEISTQTEEPKRADGEKAKELERPPLSAIVRGIANKARKVMEEILEEPIPLEKSLSIFPDERIRNEIYIRKKIRELGYAPFVPEKEIKNVRQFSKEEESALTVEQKREIQKQRLAEFKQELAGQRVGIAELQEKLAEIISRKPENPEVLMNTVWQKAPELRLSAKQIGYFREVLDKYWYRYLKIQELQIKYPAAELFMKLFGFKPQGVVETVSGPYSIHFRCHDIEDYARISSGKIGGRLEKEDIKDAKKSGGHVFGGGITVENASKPVFDFQTAEEISKAVFIHEEQHTIQRFFKEEISMKTLKGKVSQRIKKLEQISKKVDQGLEQSLDLDEQRKLEIKKIDVSKEMTGVLENYLRVLRGKIADRRAKSEILAYFKEKGTIFGIKETLMKPHSSYDYYSQKMNFINREIRETLGLPKSGLFPDWVIKATENVFRKDYEKLLDGALGAIRELQEQGKTKEEIINLLITEPLAKWSRLAKILKELPKSEAAHISKKEIRQKLIQEEQSKKIKERKPKREEFFKIH